MILHSSVVDSMKAQKATAAWRRSRLQHIGQALRFLEACAAFLAISWCTTRLPLAARASGDLLLAAAPQLHTPGFVFLVGNAIVLILLANCRHLPSKGDIYDELVKGPDRGASFVELPAAVAARGEEKRVFLNSRPLRRCRSAGTRRRIREVPVLRRAESEVVRMDGEEISVDDGEEFRRTIEAFIAKQVRFQEEEEKIAMGNCLRDMND